MAAVAAALRSRIDPHLPRATGRSEWTQVDLLALAMAAHQELAREFNCEAVMFYKSMESGPHPLVRLTPGAQAVDLDMAADRFGSDRIRVGARDQLYPDTPDTVPFVSADVYNEIYQDVAAIIKRAGLSLNETRDGRPVL